MLKRMLSVSMVFVLIFLSIFTINVSAADYTQGVAVSGTTATIWFKSNVSTTWVDVHYKVNSGAQQNVRMTYNSSTARYEQVVNVAVSNGNVIDYSFTYNNGTPAYDTAWFKYTVGSSSGTTPTNGATFYADINYGGTAVTLGAGTYTLSQMSAKGIPNDWMSSLNVPSGWTVEVFEHDNFTGTKWTYTASSSWVGTAVNDKMSSVKVYNGPVPTNPGSGLIPLNSGMQMTIQFNNNTGGAWSNSQIYVNIIGRKKGPDGNPGPFCTIAPNGTMTQCVAGQNASPYFYPMSSFNGFQIPTYVSSGRIYISMGAPLNIPFNMAADGTVGIAYPNIENPSDASYNKYFDWAEFAVVNGEVWINTTQVDMFGIPYTIEVFTGTSTNYSSFAKVGITESRASIFSAFQNEVPAEFKSLATVQAPYRIVAPIHGSFRTGQANGTYFNSYINSIWNQYTTSNFVVTVPQGTFTGRVSGTTMNFTRPGDATIYRVNKPTSEDVWGGAGALATGNEIEKVLEAQICAAFHRHVMGNAANLNNPSAYYLSGPADYFSKFFHNHSLGSKAYGFCYDDVNDQSSTIHGVSPRGAIINIGW